MFIFDDVSFAETSIAKGLHLNLGWPSVDIRKTYCIGYNYCGFIFLRKQSVVQDLDWILFSPFLNLLKKSLLML